MEKDEAFSGFLIGAGCMAVVLILSVLLAVLIATDNARDDAVKNGKAEYYLDTQNVRQWRWNN